MYKSLAIPLLCSALLGLSLQSQQPEAPKKASAKQVKKPELPKLDPASPPKLPQKASSTGQTPRPQQGERRDLVQRFPQRNPFLGVWRIQKSVRHKSNSTRITNGYAIFTKGYFSLHVIQTGAFDRRTAFQSSMRTWRIEAGHIITGSLVGVRSGSRAQPLLLEAGGLQEKRRFLFLGPRLLRIYQSAQDYLELIKVEDLQ
ncbi:MAG: hypothetical protein CSA62_06015 [Planctomycetota bacterium]|nr:MAG: hypothetical protein CSA62_06015 [Planctomycetota bacterium]